MHFKERGTYDRVGMKISTQIYETVGCMVFSFEIVILGVLQLNGQNSLPLKGRNMQVGLDFKVALKNKEFYENER